MTVKSKSMGHDIENDGKKWIFLDTKEPAFTKRACNHCGKLPVVLKLKDSMDGVYKDKNIDACISHIVEALQMNNIDMVSSCCGHGERDGWIGLATGMLLVIKKRSKK